MLQKWKLTCLLKRQNPLYHLTYQVVFYIRQVVLKFLKTSSIRHNINKCPSILQACLIGSMVERINTLWLVVSPRQYRWRHYISTTPNETKYWIPGIHAPSWVYLQALLLRWIGYIDGGMLSFHSSDIGTQLY